MLKLGLTANRKEDILAWEGKERAKEVIKNYEHEIDLINDCLFCTYRHSEKIASYDMVDCLLTNEIAVVIDGKYARFKINIMEMYNDYQKEYYPKKDFFIIRRIAKKLVRELNANQTRIDEIIKDYYSKYSIFCNEDWGNKKEQLLWGFYIEDYDEVIEEIIKEM